MKKILFFLFLIIPIISNASESITLVVPFPAGGATDTIARVAGQMLNDANISSVVLNKPGANNVIGTNFVAEHATDGKIFLIGTNGSLASNLVFPAEGMEYNKNTFDPVVSLGTISFVLSVPYSSPIKNYADYVNYVKIHPDKFIVGFWNRNTANIFYAWAEKEHLPRPTIVIYKGATPEMLDLLGNHIFSTWDTWLHVKPQVEAKKLRVLAVLDSNNLKSIQKIVTDHKVISIGKKYPDLDTVVWFGIWAKHGTSSDIIKQINTIINRQLSNPKYKIKLEKLTVEQSGGTAEDLLKIQKQNIQVLENLKK